jgi:hypothetical protein
VLGKNLEIFRILTFMNSTSVHKILEFYLGMCIKETS